MNQLQLSALMELQPGLEKFLALLTRISDVYVYMYQLVEALHYKMEGLGFNSR
jgi:hypothetical protein